MARVEDGFQLAIDRRERAVLLEPRDRGIVLWTLRYGDEVRDEKDYFADVKAAEPEPGLRALMEKLDASLEALRPKPRTRRRRES